MILIQQLKIKIPHTGEQIRIRASKALGISERDILSLEILRRSLDARRKPDMYFIYSVEVSVREEKRILGNALRNRRAKEQFSLSTREIYRFPDPSDGFRADGAAAPVIVGAGPAGLFCAYYLARAGLRPILLERGSCVEERHRDVEEYWEKGILNPSSNVQFGEGGAGTFSDGKLNTLVKDKDGRNRAVLETFVRFGAKESIMYDGKPHIGTDVLAKVVRGMREEICRLGGTVRFQSQMTDLLIQDRKLTGILVNDEEKLECSQLVLAIGHSARDTFSLLRERGLSMEAKPFAVGLRVEHPQSMINQSQYGSAEVGELGAASYKVTARSSNGRGVYSFCMCPGGYVVNASSEEGRLAVNGMSYSARDGKNANSAIIVSVGPEDYPGEGPLSGIAFQRELEEKAYQLGAGRIPVQRYGEYKSAVLGLEKGDEMPEPSEVPFGEGQEEMIMPCAKGQTHWADLSTLLPKECSRAFVEGMEQFGLQIRGFNRPDVILSGVESRTSSPVRILRDEQLQASIRGIYPCGEGAGYAGGITSAAMDGLRVAEKIAGSCIGDEKIPN